MWWIELIKMVVGMGLDKVEEDKAKNRADQYKLMARQEGSSEAALLNEDLARTRGRAATLAAASGGGLTGSAMDVLDDLSRQGRFRVRSTLWAAETDASFGGRVAKGAGMYGTAAAGAGGLLSSWSQTWGKKAPSSGSGSGAGGMMGGLFGGGGGGGNAMGGGMPASTGG